MPFALLEKSCVLVTLTFVLTRTRFFAHLLRPRLPLRAQVIALLVFLAMAFAEEGVAHQHTLLNARIVAVCAAGLLAGPWVGVLIGFAATALAYAHLPFSPAAIGPAMILAGLAGGGLHRWRPALALAPAVGFLLGASASLLRDSLLIFSGAMHATLLSEGEASVMHGLGVALILLVIAQARAQESQARAAAMAEVRALQARMNPHFLFNSLNTLAALSRIDPRSVPAVAARLGLFLRASLDQHEQPYVSLQEELDVVKAYLDVEALRLGERLSVEQAIAPHLLNALVPPFLLQPLVENAVCHGIQPCAEGGRIRLTAHAEASHLVLTVSDTGVGIAPEQQTRLFHSDACHAHALPLLRRRLQGLYGSDFRLTVASERGKGATISVRIPLQQSELPSEPAPLSNAAVGRSLHETDADATLLSR